MIEHRVSYEEEGKRLDRILMELVDESRSQIKKIIHEGDVLLNDELKKPGYKVNVGDMIKINYDRFKKCENENDLEKKSLIPEAINLDIIYEDDDILIINKPKGMVVHPAPGNEGGTLVNALLYYRKELSTIGGSLRPGVVHRLDKDTTGLMLIAKNDSTHAYYTEKFKSREIIKDYLALCYGSFPEENSIIEAPIGRHPVDRKKMSVIDGGRLAKTKIKVLTKLEYKDKIISYLKLTPVTGRTHQIRVHLAYMGYPLLGDRVYGNKKLNKKINFIEELFQGQALHAFRLQFSHRDKKKTMEFRAPLPSNFQELIRRLNRVDK